MNFQVHVHRTRCRKGGVGELQDAVCMGRPVSEAMTWGGRCEGKGHYCSLATVNLQNPVSPGVRKVWSAENTSSSFRHRRNPSAAAAQQVLCVESRQFTH